MKSEPGAAGVDSPFSARGKESGWILLIFRPPILYPFFWLNQDHQLVVFLIITPASFFDSFLRDKAKKNPALPKPNAKATNRPKIDAFIASPDSSLQDKGTTPFQDFKSLEPQNANNSGNQTDHKVNKV